MTARRVVVVGAGLSGLTAALWLAAAELEVTLIDREPVPGGRVGLLLEPSPSGGYRLDSGPLALTRPDLIDAAVEAVGRRLSDYLELIPLDPLLRARFPDGTVLQVSPDPAATIEQLAALPGGPAGGAGDVEGLRRFLHDLESAAESAVERVSTRRHPVAGLLRQLRAAPVIEDYVTDPRVRRLFNWSLVPGQAPAGSPAAALTTHTLLAAPSWVPRGGMHRLPQALARAALDAGVTLRLGTEVVELRRRRQRVQAVAVSAAASTSAAGGSGPAGVEELPCDEVVLAVDAASARRLLGTARRPREQNSVPSAWLLLIGGSLSLPPATTSRTLLFGRTGASTLEEIGTGRLATDPTMLVGIPTLSDPSVAPRGRHVASVLTVTPHLGRYPQMRRNSDGARLVTTSQDWGRIGHHYRDHIDRVLLARGFAGLTRGAEVEHVLTPVDWLARDLHNGSPFGSSGSRLLLRNPQVGENITLAGADLGPADTILGAVLAGTRAAAEVAAHR